MVMPHKHYIKSRHALGYLKRRIFAISHQSVAALSGMEHTHYHIGILALLDYRNPLAGSGLHVVKPQPLPQYFGQPCGYGRSEQSENSHLHPVVLHNLIGSECRLARGSVDDIGTQYGHVALSAPALKHFASGFHIVVAYIACIVAHEVHHSRSHVGSHRVDKVVVVHSGLPLENVAVVEQNHIVAIALPRLFYGSVDTRKASCRRLSGYEVIGEEVSVYVACLKQFYSSHGGCVKR